MTREQLKELLNSNTDLLENLMQSTLETNKLFNLTAIEDEEQFRELMIYDSLIPTKHIDFNNKKILDVGTGAGFPGLPLAIVTKGDFTLLDSTKKKIDYINTFIKNNNINNVVAISDRAEDFAHKNREKFDYVIARAVASLQILLELCIPMVKVGGYFLAMKSNKYEEEINDSVSALKKLNAEVVETYCDVLPNSNENRYLIVIRKKGPTNKRYPRSYNEIKSKSL